MIPSSTMCRAQEALHRSRAASSPLVNVREIAERAAAAWAGEAMRADERERREQARSIRAGAEREARRLADEPSDEDEARLAEAANDAR